MKPIPAAGAVLAILGSILLLRIVLHGYTDHGHLDVFHLVVGLAMALIGLLLVRRSLARTPHNHRSSG